MNKTSISALVVAVVALLVGGATYVNNPGKLGGYTPSQNSPAGFIHSLSTSTAIATTDFCSESSVQWLGTSALATGTLPAATSVYAACPAFAQLGSYVKGKIVNDSTNTVAYAAGTGDVFKCETIGVGTSTVSGTCTATGFTVLASSTVDYSVFFDSASSSMVFLVGNNYK